MKEASSKIQPGWAVFGKCRMGDSSAIPLSWLKVMVLRRKHSRFRSKGSGLVISAEKQTTDWSGQQTERKEKAKERDLWGRHISSSYG